MTEDPSGDILARGPVHKLTVEFELNRFRGELLPELDRLKELGIIRIIDLLAVRKDCTGAFMVMMASDLRPDEAVDFGSSVGKLIGLGIGGREGAEIGAKLGAEMLADGHVFEPDDCRGECLRVELPCVEHLHVARNVAHRLGPAGLSGVVRAATD